MSIFEINNSLNSDLVTFRGVPIPAPISGTKAIATCGLNDRIIVIYANPNGQFDGLTTRNAFAFDRNGNVLWNVQAQGIYDNLFKRHYVSFHIDEATGRLKLYTQLGHMVYLDTNTGEIEDLGGRPW